MKELKGTFTGERALYDIHNALVTESIFEDGESPLKECSDLEVTNTEFRWKYPLWYGKNIKCQNINILETARSGIWYTQNIEIRDSDIIGPKYFRRCKDISLINVNLPNASETLWGCEKIYLENVKATGDYFGLNCKDIEIDNLYLDGNYCFDGAKDVVIKNSILLSKDSFWNTENVIIKDSKIVGEYLGWNSKKITFINCEIESHQGLCYIDKLTLVNCSLKADLCLELCSNIDAEIINEVESIKNPISGVIKVKKVGELVLDENYIDTRNTRIVIEDKDE